VQIHTSESYYETRPPAACSRPTVQTLVQAPIALPRRGVQHGSRGHAV